MPISHTLKGLLLTFALMLVPVASLAEESPANRDLTREAPAGMIEIESTSIRLLMGGNWGTGTLHFRGKHYPFKVKGLSAGGIGIEKLDAIGNIYFLDKLEDFAGTYSFRTGGATAIEGSTKGTYENKQGVVFTLVGKSTGLALALGVGSISITLEDQ